MSHCKTETAEDRRLREEAEGRGNWRRWGTYLSERQWATVREDYSRDGTAWEYFPFDQAAARAYRWGEDGLLGWCDRGGRLCFAPALWNGRDPILKERLFGLTGHEGNHAEDVKEVYFYEEATPTHSYVRGLYKYPQGEFPYERLREENRRRSTEEPEYELEDTGIFDEQRYFDVVVEYAKAAPEDILIQLTVMNRGPERAKIHVLPTLWFRNTWSWGCRHDAEHEHPRIMREGEGGLRLHHATLGDFVFAYGRDEGGGEVWFTENETNHEKLFGSPTGVLTPRTLFMRR
ncbi:MAG: hypothetical protein SNJ84_06315 [Verrucomicrobiia bacterium]